MSASPETKPTPVDEFPNKVFVGNLSFRTTEGQLHDFFADVGEVKESRIITRGPRSLGFGFVAFADAATAEKAVELKNHKELAGREINVEVARPMPEGALAARASKPARRRQPSRRSAAARKDGKKTQARVDTVENGEEAKAEKADAPAAAAESAAPTEGEAKDKTTREGGRSRPRRQRRFPKKDKDAKDDEDKQDDRTPSDTVVFVGNLPFSTEDEELTKLFADFAISSAHVVVSKKTSRPKGFGFVTFATSEDQAKALAKFTAEPITLNERVLTVKAALSETPAVTDSAAEGESA
ncbi:hypothetical protein GGI12_000613 [Dipsacomyces acuminosporus]|nr:hypothetical protein GGI12_000613 [Dipsacomyces acuminosporus]